MVVPTLLLLLALLLASLLLLPGPAPPSPLPVLADELLVVAGLPLVVLD